MKSLHILLALAAVAAGLLPAAAGVPEMLSYQGRLVDGDGDPVSGPTQLRFRLYRGGDDVSNPSTGVIVYGELVIVQPSVFGVFSHLIGSGAPSDGCAEIPCALDAIDFADGTIPLWIEVTVDADGLAGSPDDNLLLPRTRIGAVGYAFQVASIDGAEGGSLSGLLSAESLTAQDATFGDGTADDVELSFDGAGATDPTLSWSAPSGEFLFSAPTRYVEGLRLPDARSLGFGPFSNPTDGAGIRLQTTQSLFADGNLDGEADEDHVFSLCYNCLEGSAGREVPSEYAMKYNWSMTSAPASGVRATQYSWNFAGPGQTNFKPFLFYLDTDFGGGYADPYAKWTFRTDKSTVALHINQNGNVMIGGDSPQPIFPLDVLGTIHTDAEVRLDPDQVIRFGANRAVQDEANGNRLLLGPGYPAFRFGTGSITEIGLHFGDAMPAPALTWSGLDSRFEFNRLTRHEQGLVIPTLQSVRFGPFTNPVPGAMLKITNSADSFADGNLDGIPDEDHVLAICYNCADGSSGPEIPTEYAMKAQWEMSFAPDDGRRIVEHNWNFLGPGQTNYRPYHFFLDTDFPGGYANPTAKWFFKTDKQTVALHINQNGNVKLGAETPQPEHRLEVVGSILATEDLHLGADRSIQFDARNAIEEDTAGDRLVVGSSYETVVVRANDLKIADEPDQGGTSLVLGSCVETVASSSVSIGNCNVISFTGAAEIRSIDGCDPQRNGRILLVMCGSDPTTMCDGNGSRCSGGNLRLQGADADFACSSDDVLTLACDGANWRQVGVSLN